MLYEARLFSADGVEGWPRTCPMFRNLHIYRPVIRHGIYRADVPHSNSSQPASICELRSVCSVMIVHKWKGNSGAEAFLSFVLLAVEFNPVGVYKMKVTLHVIARVSQSPRADNEFGIGIHCFQSG